LEHAKELDPSDNREHIEHESLRSDAVSQELARESLLIRSGFSTRCPQARCDRQVLVIDSGERLLSSCAVVGSGAASDQRASEVYASSNDLLSSCWTYAVLIVFCLSPAFDRSRVPTAWCFSAVLTKSPK